MEGPQRWWAEVKISPKRKSSGACRVLCKPKWPIAWMPRLAGSVLGPGRSLVPDSEQEHPPHKASTMSHFILPSSPLRRCSCSPGLALWGNTSLCKTSHVHKPTHSHGHWGTKKERLWVYLYAVDGWLSLSRWPSDKLFSRQHCAPPSCSDRPGFFGRCLENSS